MKVIVPVKRVIDPYVKIRISPDTHQVETQHVKHVMNPFDEIALEEAIRLYEKNIVTDILAVSIGGDTCQEVLRHALALGATRAELIQTDSCFGSLNIAKILNALVLREGATLVLLGKQAIDDDNNQTAQMLAALLGWPQATFASKIEIEGNTCTVAREIDSGVETLELTLPAVVSVDLRLNTPRYASLPNIMKAKQKPLVMTPINSLPLASPLVVHQTSLSIKAPQPRQSGMKVDSVDELIKKLEHDAGVL
jgi:electron transfer flavoprotein beta subunit